MNIRADKVRHTLDFFRDIDLLPAADVERILWLFAPAFPFRAQLESADSIHVHVKVADTERLAHDAILNAGGRPESVQAGYLKYAFAAGVNLIFSSIPVAEDDRLAMAATPTRPFLDHAGIDIRKDTADTRRRFDAVVATAAREGWRHVAQGGAGRTVRCCHTEVGEKHWVYPPASLRAWVRPIELALGPLVVQAGTMGCDLRPIDPAHPLAREVACCGPAGASHGATNGSMQATELSARESALIALAVAQARRSRRDIETFEGKCLDAGCTPHEIREAARVAAATLAGIDDAEDVKTRPAPCADRAVA